MSIEEPAPEILAVIEGAVAWFRSVAMKDVRLESARRDNGPRNDGLSLIPTRRHSGPSSMNWERTGHCISTATRSSATTSPRLVTNAEAVTPIIEPQMSILGGEKSTIYPSNDSRGKVLQQDGLVLF